MLTCATSHSAWPQARTLQGERRKALPDGDLRSCRCTPHWTGVRRCCWQWLWARWSAAPCGQQRTSGTRPTSSGRRRTAPSAGAAQEVPPSPRRLQHSVRCHGCLDILLTHATKETAAVPGQQLCAGGAHSLQIHACHMWCIVCSRTASRRGCGAAHPRSAAAAAPWQRRPIIQRPMLPATASRTKT